MTDVTYKLDELARAAGTSARTVRYYVQRGLLKAPAFRGKDTAYGHEHLVRLRAIRRLQDAFFPLDAIAVELERRSLAELERIADGTEIPAQAAEALGSSQMQEVGPSPSGSPARGRVFHRIELAPGVELSVADDAPHASRTMVDKLFRELELGGNRR